MTLPSRSEIFRSALRDLDHSRNELSSARDWLKSDWAPVGSALTPRAGDARRTALRQIAEAKDAIDVAKGEILAALEDLG